MNNNNNTFKIERGQTEHDLFTFSINQLNLFVKHTEV